MATNDDPSANDNPAASGGEGAGSNQGKFAGNRNVSAGDGPLNDYGGVHGNVINNNYYSSGAGGSNPNGGGQPSGQQGGASTAMPLNIIGLNNVMRRSLNANTVLDICQIIAASSPYCSDLDYDGLPGNGWQNKTLSLIDYCRRRRALTLLVDTINDTVGNAMLNPTHDDWHNWAAGEDAK